MVPPKEEINLWNHERAPGEDIILSTIFLTATNLFSNNVVAVERDGGGWLGGRLVVVFLLFHIGS